MLFSSYIFIFAFLPITIFSFILISKKYGWNASTRALVLSSLVFYGYWNPIYLVLISSSMVVNYAIGNKLMDKGRNSKQLLITGVAFNLGLLGYFKYRNFLIQNLESFLDVSYNLDAVVLPLAISFFTFQQIAYLVDASRGEIQQDGFWNYALFVSFFPQLIAGPIVHHKWLMPQLKKAYSFGLNLQNFYAGMVLFTLGLSKKLIIADSLAPYVDLIFDVHNIADSVSAISVWVASLAYTFQLYFDFSGYADMAIGLGWIFGIALPENFLSPYRSRNIIEFWRRWHVTLSTFLRDYLYISLGGNRKGPARRQINLVLTMLLGGIWHGAGWNFLVWGGLHGVYLVINHAWISVSKNVNFGVFEPLVRAGSYLLTFVAVVIGWIYFRALDVESANRLIEILVYGDYNINEFNSIEGNLLVTLLLGGIIALLPFRSIKLALTIAPPKNLDDYYKSYFDDSLVRQAGFVQKTGAFLVGFSMLICIFLLAEPMEFIYFQF